ncbi:MAG TPA: hypothetical protein EYG08_03465 [Myxococcales bacterium]|nr:hypothetical protein [Myxococcales bacterium]
MRGQDLEVLDLSGESRERGRIHGEALRERIHDAVATREGIIAEETGVPVSDYRREFLRHTNFLPAIERWTPELLNEVHGISEGAALDFDRVYAYQLIDEEWLYRRDRGITPPSGSDLRCSTIGIDRTRDQPTLVAPNLDIEHWRDGSQVVLRIRQPETDREIYSYSFAGLIILAGLNSKGVGVCVNALMGLPHGPTGLPVPFAIRGALERNSMAEAISFLHEIDHATGQNYMIGDSWRARSVECSSKSKTEYEWRRGFGRVCHTNHPLALEEADRSEGGLGQWTAEERRRRNENTVVRLGSLESRLEDADASIDRCEVKAILSSHDDPDNPVCRHGDGPTARSMIGVTLGSLIYELSEAPTFHAAPGPACETEYRTFRF